MLETFTRNVKKLVSCHMKIDGINPIIYSIVFNVPTPSVAGSGPPLSTRREGQITSQMGLG